MVIKVYVASSTGSVGVKKHQQAVVSFLEANRLSFQEVDITMGEEERLWMCHHVPRDKHPGAGNPLTPQIFNGDHYCGDYEDFFQAKENNGALAFLGVSGSPAAEKDTSRAAASIMLSSLLTFRTSSKHQLQDGLAAQPSSLSLYVDGIKYSLVVRDNDVIL